MKLVNPPVWPNESGMKTGVVEPIMFPVIESALRFKYTVAPFPLFKPKSYKSNRMNPTDVRPGVNDWPNGPSVWRIPLAPQAKTRWRIVDHTQRFLEHEAKL